MKIEDAARVCHEANRAYCITLGDLSQPLWDDAPDWQKNSAISGVKFHLDNPKVGDYGSHNNWLCEKEKDGWKYGPIKDPEKKEHPCFVPFHDLPIEQQMKDRLFRSVVHALKDLVSH